MIEALIGAALGSIATFLAVSSYYRAYINTKLQHMIDENDRRLKRNAEIMEGYRTRREKAHG